METTKTGDDPNDVGGNVLLLGVSFDSGNMGVGALAASAVQLLINRYGDRSVVLLDYSKAANDRIVIHVEHGSASIGRINLRFSWKLFLPNNVFLLIVLAWLRRVPGLRRYIVSHNSTLRAIDASKIAFAMSGGDSFSDIYGLERFFYVTLPIVLLILMDKKVVLLPQTIGPFDGYVSRRVAGGLLRKALRIYSRDRMGVDEARKLIRDPARFDNVQFSYDLGFVLQPRRPERVGLVGDSSEDSAHTTTVGLNVSGLLMMGGYDRRNMFNLKVGYHDLVDALVRRFCEFEGVHVLLVPHVFGDDPESDQRACRAVYDGHIEKYPGRISCVESRHDQHEIKCVIGRCDFFVGARMHACIAALSQGVPAVCVAYSRKFVGVLESVGAEHLVVDPRKMTLAEIMDVVVDRFADRQRLALALEAKMPEVKRRVFGMMDDLN